MKKNKRRIISACFLFVFLLTFCSCKEKSADIIIKNDAVYVDMCHSSYGECPIGINYLYRGTIPSFCVAKAEGENVELLEFSCEDATSDFEYSIEEEGYHMGTLCIRVKYPRGYENQEIRIDKLVLKANNDSYTVIFTSPIKNTIFSAEFTNTGNVSPNIVTSGCGFYGQEFFSYTAETDLVIDDFSLGTHVSLEDMTISVIDQNTGMEIISGDETLFPLEIFAGQMFEFSGVVSSSEYKGYQNVHTSSVLSYHIGSISEKQIWNLFVEGPSDETTVKEAIRIMLSQ